MEKDIEGLQELVPFWSKLTLEQQTGLQRSILEKSFQKGEFLHRGVEDCAGLFIVKKGQLRAYILSENGKEVTLYHLCEMDMCLLSASCMMNNIQFEVYVEAEKETEALLIPTSAYQKLMEQSLAVSNYTNQLMASRFSDVMWLIEQILFKSFDKRLAVFLDEQSNRDGSDTLHITQEEIARHLGSAREVVTRMLKYFQTEKVVSLFRGGIKIEDHERLIKMLS